jgi:D-alanyl-D-alanine carboxypeptidase-like protein
VRILTLVTLLALAGVASGTASTPAFRGSVTAIGPERAAAMTGVSWRQGCPVQLRDLRVVTATYRDFSTRARTGRVIVHRDVAAGVLGVLRRLYAAGFPLRRMVPVDAYGASDFRSIEADNTSAFNCRYVDGTQRWSEHAYGRAIDVNPIENPFVSGGRTSHPASVPYLDRTPCRAGMACTGNVLVQAFQAIGWGWGGNWGSVKDYQHFSASGR